METQKNRRPRLLTGDRTTGYLHLGHYVGSLQNRVALQREYETFIMLADVQALTTHFDRPENLRVYVREIALDYLAAGIDPDHATIFIQSMIPEIAELTVFFSMFVTVNSLRHNPTIKAEMAEGGMKDLYYGFLGYPVSQSADITVCKAELVPVGDDQLPHIEQTRKIVRRFNELYRPVLVEPRALLGQSPRLPGTDGRGKMSKSKGNAILLRATTSEIQTQIRQAKTDPARIRKSDPGHPDVCPVFQYHRAFNAEEIDDVRRGCESGAMGCVACKERVAKLMDERIEPMRERRERYRLQPSLVDDILMHGTAKVRSEAARTMAEVREAMQIHYFSETNI